MRFFLLVSILFTINVSMGQTTDINSTHRPKKSTFLAAVLPGAGHIYNNIHRKGKQKNRLWWKLPIIYGGISTSIYFIIDNNKEFHSFKNERLYRQETGLINMYPEYSSSQLQVIQEDFRKWRDMSVISVLGFYLIQLVDANVEGHLLHFDTSDKLSLSFTPQFINYNTSYQARLNIKIKF